MKNIILPLLIAAVAAGCASSDKKAETTDRSTAPTQAATGTTGGPSTTTPQSTGRVSGTSIDPTTLKKSVYFDFDSNVVKDEFQPVVQGNARYLADKRDTKVRIEGNTDERGSREYNLALGQRRAEAVKKVMTVLGVQENRIETVSFGEEKPAMEGHDEAAWSQNRRADIRYGAQ